MKVKIKRLQKIINIALSVVFILCLFILIRWSTVTIPDIPIMNSIMYALFVTKTEADSILESLVTGYVIGFITYALTVMLPTYFRNKPIQIQFAQEMQELYSCSLSTLLIIYKSVSTQEEWKKVDKSDDLEALNNDFFERVKKFDICSAAYTIYGKSNGEKYEWSEYLEKMCEHIQVKARQILLYYQAYMTESMYDVIVDTQNSKFLGLITGNCVNIISNVISENGYRYFESISVSEYYKITTNPAPIFSQNSNLNLLRQYIELLKKQKDIIYRILGEKRAVKKNYYLNEMTQSKIGKCESAIWRMEETHERKEGVQ